MSKYEIKHCKTVSRAGVRARLKEGGIEKKSSPRDERRKEVSTTSIS